MLLDSMQNDHSPGIMKFRDIFPTFCSIQPKLQLSTSNLTAW